MKDAFKDAFHIGTAFNTAQITGSDSVSVKLTTKHFNALTAENDMKWERLQPRKDEFNFQLADKFVEYGEANNMFLIGHTLVWHSQAPDWLFVDDERNDITRDELLERMRNHIFTVVGRYKGRIHGWDVVNEAVDEDGELRKSKFLEIIGEDYIEKAFEYAREADPDAELYYNDYSLPNAPKRNGVVRLVSGLLEKGVKVDAIGMQGHYNLKFPELIDLEESITAFSNLGVKVMITELDVSVLPHPTENVGADVSLSYEQKKELDPFQDFLPDSMHQKLASRYAELFNVFLKYNDQISRVTFWGVNDRQSWLNYWPIRERANYPLLFDRNNKPKPAFYEVINTVNQ